MFFEACDISQRMIIENLSAWGIFMYLCRWSKGDCALKYGNVWGHIFSLYYTELLDWFLVPVLQ